LDDLDEIIEELNKNYVTTKSDREGAKWRVDVELEGTKFDMHLRNDLTIVAPFNMVESVSVKGISQIMAEINSELRLKKKS